MRQLIRPALAALLPLMLIAPLTVTAANFIAKDLAAEEAKFAAYSVKNGMRAAFLEFFADQSWLLRPELVDAKPWLAARPDPAIILDWKSQRTILSSSGDFGMSTGPWLLRNKADPKAPAAHGQFFSVWQKQKNGEWKVFIDHGISHDPTATPDALPTAPLVALDLRVPAAAVRADNAENDFIVRSANTTAANVYREVMTARTLSLREGALPLEGKAAILESVSLHEGTWSWTPKLQGAAAAKDFAYAVGNYLWKKPDGESAKGQYVRVWVRDALGEAPDRWTLAGEVMTPEPAPKKQ
jgi:ketosteroid isomerase-like protein